ncbi:MAG: 4-hydroxybutyrate--acetyl-CoA CoA transferase [Eubacterium sp.]|nr:4-hydroxybutyrate--acetyl-CoA CoA transferase [Eubacterium sp.]
MDVQEMLRQKTISIEEAVAKIGTGAYVYTYGPGEPVAFLKKMSYLKESGRENVSIVNVLNVMPYEYYTEESYRGVINNISLFFSGTCAGGQKTGRIAFAPNHLRNSIADRMYYHERTGRPVSVYIVSASPMDRHGFFSTGLVGMSNQTLIRKADIVMLEINDKVPRTFGDSMVHISQVDYLFEGHSGVPCLPSREADEVEQRIGENIADLIEDGSTIQLGIGGIPNAVAASLRDKKNLGVFTEMMNDGIMHLYKDGVVTNTENTLYPGRMVTAFSFGSQELYDFLDDNPGVLHLAVERTNNPSVIAQNRKMVSVNTTLQIDLMGQCASEAIGTRQISGTGGQSEFAIGAKASPGGKSIVALPSTAMIKGKDGSRRRISKILPVHGEGTVLSLLRADTDYVVTEYGVAALRGATMRERAEELIAVAHPDYRDELRSEARKRYIL